MQLHTLSKIICKWIKHPDDFVLELIFSTVPWWSWRRRISVLGLYHHEQNSRDTCQREAIRNFDDRCPDRQATSQNYLTDTPGVGVISWGVTTMPWWGSGTWILNFVFSSLFSALLQPVVIGVPGKNHRISPSHWQLSHTPHPRFEPRQWWETASSLWRRLRPHRHQGRPASSCWSYDFWQWWMGVEMLHMATSGNAPFYYTFHLVKEMHWRGSSCKCVKVH